MEKNNFTMPFETDKQTLEELNLPGKFRQGSVYHLFNRTKTRGGEQELDNMFHHPLTDAKAINDRIAIFRFFQEQQLVFPFDPQQVTLMREYLDTGTGSNAPLTLAGIFIKKGLAVVTRDEQYKKIMQGLQATIITLNKCHVFVSGLRHVAGVYASRVAAIGQILGDKRVEKLFNTDIYHTGKNAGWA
jgi:DNA mismatch repair protein MutS